MEIRLDGRTAVITGGSKGLGLAIATKFAAAGADVAILARRRDALEEAKRTIEATAKGRAAAFACDVAKADDIRNAYDSIMRIFGKVDILVNNAGASQTGKFVDISDEVWQADLDLKLFAAIRLARLVLPQMS